MSSNKQKAPLQNRPNHFYSIASVAIVLFLLGFFGIVLIQANQLVRVFKEKVNVLVEIKNESTKDQILVLNDQLESSVYVKDKSIKFTSKAEAADILREDFGEDFMKMDFENPLFDVISFNLNSEYMQADSLAWIKSELKNEGIVKDVYYQEAIVDQIGRNLETVGYIAFIIGIFFLIIAIALIHNTIKLALHADRFKIKNMELVGASWQFISKPYMWKSLQNGFWSAILAIIVLLAIILLAQNDLPDLLQLQEPVRFIVLFVLLFVLGIIITAGSTYYVVNKYLRMRVDDMY